MDETILDTVLLDRPRDAVKGDFGDILVVGGSHRYTNTPAIVAGGALRTGADLVRVAAPERSADATATFALNLITTPLDGHRLRPGNVDAVLDAAAGVDCLAVGPGLGRADATLEAVRDLLGARDVPAVVDADALRALPDHADSVGSGDVLTPHAGEFAVLTGEEIGGAVEDRKETVRAAAAEFGCTVLLKGPVDVVSDGDRVETNGTGNPYMTRGGTGDVLTGVAAALLAQGNDPVDAAGAAAYINGSAGDTVAMEKGRGFTLEEHLEAVADVVA